MIFGLPCSGSVTLRSRIQLRKQAALLAIARRAQAPDFSRGETRYLGDRPRDRVLTRANIADNSRIV